MCVVIFNFAYLIAISLFFSIFYSDGLIVANDLDNKRCYMLVHQAKRLNSPCLIITNNDAANFPNVKISQVNMLSFLNKSVCLLQLQS